MAVLTVTKVTKAGVNSPAAQAANAGGDTIALGTRPILLRMVNTGAQKVVTIDAQRTCNQGGTHDITVTVPATTGDKSVLIDPPGTYQNASGVADVSYDGVTGLTVFVSEV